MTGQREGDEPTAARIEALVRAIEAKETGIPPADPGARPVEPGAPAAPPSRASAATQQPAGSTVSGTTSRGRAPAPPVPRTEAEHRRAAPPTPYRAPGRPPGPAGPIPGLIGRQAWEASLVDEAERQQRYGRPLAIVIADLVPDEEEPSSMGSAMVGRMAPRCAAVLLAVARASDRVTRLGVSRFGVLLLEADEAAATTYASRAARLLEPWLAGSVFPMHLSMGWAVARGPEELRQALHDAEVARPTP